MEVSALFQTLGDGSFLFDPLRCQRKQSNKKEPSPTVPAAHSVYYSLPLMSQGILPRCDTARIIAEYARTSFSEKNAAEAWRFGKLFVSLWHYLTGQRR